MTQKKREFRSGRRTDRKNSGMTMTEVLIVVSILAADAAARQFVTEMV